MAWPANRMSFLRRRRSLLFAFQGRRHAVLDPPHPALVYVAIESARRLMDRSCPSARKQHSNSIREKHALMEVYQIFRLPKLTIEAYSSGIDAHHTRTLKPMPKRSAVAAACLPSSRCIRSYIMVASRARADKQTRSDNASGVTM